MSLGSRINEIRREKQVSIDELCVRSGVPKGTLSKITAGITTSPTLDTVRAIAKALDCRLDDFDDNPRNSDLLSADERTHIQKYRSLDPYGKEAVDGVLDVEWRRCAAETAQESSDPDNVIYIVRWYPSPMSAGTGTVAGDDSPEELELTKRPPRGTSYVAPVRGDSMEPTYHDGDKLFIRSCEEIDIGQIGVFWMDGKQWVKEQGDGALISHNPAYAPRPMAEGVRCQGLVLGICDESYFE